MSSYALVALQQALREAQAEYADTAAAKKAEIDAGRRAQSAVDHAASVVADLQHAINTLEAAERADQVGVGDE